MLNLSNLDGKYITGYIQLLVPTGMAAVNPLIPRFSLRSMSMEQAEGPL